MAFTIKIDFVLLVLIGRVVRFRVYGGFVGGALKIIYSEVVLDLTGGK